MEPNVSNPSSNQKKKTLWANIKEWIQVIVIALIISLPIRYFIAEPFIVNGASMDPTFATGQFLIVDRLSYRFENPARGDVIVFEYPNNPKIYYIKRIIGLPGETIAMKDGEITITNKDDAAFTAAHPNGFTLNEPYIDAIHKAHDTLTTTLNKDNYFVMGDNRLQSSDSRVWGDLNRDLIVGKPFIRLLPIPSISIWPGKESQ